ncbi:tetratricopeptide repeat protein [Helicobacter sp. 13S00477-4]|uniref:tetratricopeptide repeat protein n=1 Tax=Helicobacter sp. 13S00477-4 TaxID=1905759 RepID=UPI000BA651C6|nr:tetratricopeptide repeat protein [Helicobacter sp. 13S00477-4]PAF50557.1 hypothetical protein BKH44_07645 [Helicobacter sp. 13S00477-4]
MLKLFSSAKNAYDKSNYKECISYCVQILSISPLDTQVWKLCAFALFSLGECKKAIEYLEYSLNLCEDVPSKIVLAEMYRRLNNPQKAIEILCGLKLKDNIDFHFNLARAYSDIGDFLKSIQHYSLVLEISPNDVEAMYNLGNQYIRIKDFTNAINLFQKAFDLGYENAGMQLASIYSKHFEEQKALKIYETISIQELKDPYFYFNYANTLRYALYFEESEEMYLKALSLCNDPIFYLNYAYLLLSLGRYKEGFTYYQKRLLLKNILPIEGLRVIQDIDYERKDVLVYYEQGFGDSLMFSRFLDKLKVKNLQIYIQKPLFRIFSDKYKVNLRYSIDEITPYENAFSLLSLPAILNTSEVSLSAPESKNFQIKKIGIFFSSHPDFIYFEEKSIPVELLLHSLKGFEIYSLQPEGISREICRKFGVKDLSYKIKDFKDTFIELKKLDLLISIDSAIVHLAGMYNIPTIVLLHKRYDWRWGKLGQIYPIKSDWYDSVLGIAQEQNGDWTGVLKILERHLRNV